MEALLAKFDWFGLSALVVAITAIIISVKALHHNQRHMQLSLRPWLSGHYILQTDKELAIEVENRGVGPAIIKHWCFWHTSSREDCVVTGQSDHLKNLIASKLHDPRLRFTYTSKKRSSILAPGEKWRVFELKAADTCPEAMTRAMDDVKEFCIQVDYQSFYEEDFTELVSFRKIDDPSKATL